MTAEVLTRIAQRQIAQHTHLLLELRCAAGVDGVMATVVRAGAISLMSKRPSLRIKNS